MMVCVVTSILLAILILVIYWKGSESYSLDANNLANYDNRTLTRSRRQTQGQSYSGTKCTSPAQPDHGRWVYLNNGSRDAANEQVDVNTAIVFSCRHGYQLSATNEASLAMFCTQNGEWNVAVMPLCQKLCPSLYNNPLFTVSCQNNGSLVPCDKATDNTILTYKCAPYYEPVYGRPKSSSCYDGVWDYKPDCIPVCGEKRVSAVPLLVGGHDVERGDYPWVVAVYSSKDSDPYFTNICSGNLITTEIVVTAAHCVSKKETGRKSPVRYYRVSAGKYYNQYDDPRDIDSAQYSEVAQIEIPRQYKAENKSFFGDIALLKLKTSMILSQVVQPVCYNNLPILEDNAHGVVTGWGYTTSSSQPSETLKELEVAYRTDERCFRNFDEDFAFTYFTNDKLCAESTNKNTGVCKGDSGIGLVFRNPDYQGRYFLHGVSSLAHSYNKNGSIHCNIHSGTLYTKVASYLNWIQLKVRQWTTEKIESTSRLLD